MARSTKSNTFNEDVFKMKNLYFITDYEYTVQNDSQQLIENPIITFVKQNTIIDPHVKILKKDLWKKYCEEETIVKEKLFNKIIKKELKLPEKKINNDLYWIGIEILLSPKDDI